jgi:signal transduction histidine kinase
LAVDDDPVYLHQLSRMLQGEGFEVQLAPSGEEALQLLSLQPVDCLVLDLNMPGIDGLETCRRLKAAPGLRDVPVIMLTGSEDRRSLLAGYGAGADDFLTKSNDGEVLRARVLSQIRRKQGQEETRRIREELLRRELEATEERAARKAAEERAAHSAELELKNQELEAFSYSVAHDLRAPLRGIDGFSLALLEDYDSVLDEAGKKYLAHIRNSTVHMARLIDDLLKLSKVTRSEFLPGEVDLTAIAQSAVGRLRDRSPDRKVEIEIQPGLTAAGDPALLMIALENLLGNAWKFTAKQERSHISFSAETQGRSRVFVVRDNGAGFDMGRVGRLFNVFTRLHSAQDFEGTGIGLATTLRVVRRHGGKIWAEGEVGKGAAFFFTLEA